MSRRRIDKMNELTELGHVFLQWGMMIIGFGLATMLFGFILLVIGKVCFEEKTDLILEFITNTLR